MLEVSASCQSRVVKSSKTDNEKDTEPSCRVGYRMALAGEANTFAEMLIKICAVEMATCVLGEVSLKKLETAQ